MSDSKSLFAAVIEEHLALKRRNAHLNGEQPLDEYGVADPFDNHALFKSEAVARREEEETGDYPAIVAEWAPVAVGVSAAPATDEAWLERQRCQDFDWGD